MRKAQRYEPGVLEPPDAIIREERIIWLADSIEQLPELQRRAVRMKYFTGLGIDEIADRLDRSAGSVAGIIRRGMKSLRSYMNRYE